MLSNFRLAFFIRGSLFFHLFTFITIAFLITNVSCSSHSANFTVYCQKKLTCLEFFDCCRWFTDSLCPGPAHEHCLTGINGRPLERSLTCGCSTSAPDMMQDDFLTLPTSFYKNKETILSSCRLLMSTLGSKNEPCRVFASCCDALLGDCIFKNGGRGRKTIYCTPKSSQASFCECTPNDRDRSIFDLRRPEGVGSLTDTCLYDSKNCREFSYCCGGYLDYCPGEKKEFCAIDGENGVDKRTAVCECAFSSGSRLRTSLPIVFVAAIYLCFGIFRG